MFFQKTAWCKIGDSGAEYIAAILKSNNSLKNLILGTFFDSINTPFLFLKLTDVVTVATEIGNKGKRQIFDALKTNSSLTDLDIGFENHNILLTRTLLKNW